MVENTSQEAEETKEESSNQQEIENDPQQELIEKDDDPEPFKLHSQEETPRIELTSSPFPGTTLRVLPIEDLHLGWKIYDTPGVPNLHHITTFMDNLEAIPHLLHQKRVSEQKFQFRIGN